MELYYRARAVNRIYHWVIILTLITSYWSSPPNTCITAPISHKTKRILLVQDHSLTFTLL